VYYNAAVPTFNSTADRPYDLNATVGDDVVFNCTPHAVPEASIIWYQNGEQIDRKSPKVSHVTYGHGLTMNQSAL